MLDIRRALTLLTLLFSLLALDACDESTDGDADAGADNPAALGPAGTVHCSMESWARFAAAHLAGAQGDERFLSAASWSSMHPRRRAPTTPSAGASSMTAGPRSPRSSTRGATPCSSPSPSSRPRRTSPC
jgi:hypothetical protein